MPEIVVEPMSWTPERVSQALRLYLLEGHTASAVAHALGGVTRAAVIAKIRRLGCLKRQIDVVGAPRLPAKRTSVPRTSKGRVEFDRRCFPPQRSPAPLPPLREVAATGAPVTLACLPEGACSWPIDDPGPGLMHLARFCAGPATDGRYCAAHRAIAVRSEPSRAGA